MKRLIIALAASAFALPAFAADLGGNCCADLEERIAELEATTARKGNRKVSLVVSGQVSKALLWHDIEGLAGANKLRGVDNANSGSRLRFEGMAKISSALSAGFVYEFGLDETRGKLLYDALPANDLTLRHAAVWLNTAAGKVTIGHTSSATDGIAEISTANTAVASLLMSLEPMWAYSNLPQALNPTGFDGNRMQLLRYDSPTFAGFTASVAWGGGESTAGLPFPATIFADDVMDAAIRYSGEFAGFRVAAGIGHRIEKFALIDIESKTTTGSASVMHMPSGLFVNMAAGHQADGLFGDMRMAHTQFGIERSLTDLGRTTLFGEYAVHRLQTANIDSNFWGVGLVQAIDGAAMDLFVSYRKYDIEGFDAASVGMAGMRVRF